MNLISFQDEYKRRVRNQHISSPGKKGEFRTQAAFFQRNGSLRYVASHGCPAYNSRSFGRGWCIPSSMWRSSRKRRRRKCSKGSWNGENSRGKFRGNRCSFDVAVSLGCFPFFWDHATSVFFFVGSKRFTAFTKVLPSRTCRHLILEHLIVLFYKPMFSRCLKGWCPCHVDENSHDPICQQSNNQQVIHQRSIFFHDNIFTQKNNGLVRTSLTSLLICSSFDREDDHPLLICSARQEQPNSSYLYSHLQDVMAIWGRFLEMLPSDSNDEICEVFHQHPCKTQLLQTLHRMAPNKTTCWEEKKLPDDGKGLSPRLIWVSEIWKAN